MVLVVRVGEDFGQFLIGHVGEFGEVQEVKVHLQRGHAAEGLWRGTENTTLHGYRAQRNALIEREGRRGMLLTKRGEKSDTPG